MFEVGKIVWYIDAENARVKVCKVVEEIIKKTLDGEEKNYIFSLWAGREFRRISKSKLTGDFYSTKEEAKSAMLMSADDAISKMLQRAEQEAGELITVFQKPTQEAPIFTNDTEQQEATTLEEGVEVTLPDGTVAKVRGL